MTSCEFVLQKESYLLTKKSSVPSKIQNYRLKGHFFIYELFYTKNVFNLKARFDFVKTSSSYHHVFTF